MPVIIQNQHEWLVVLLAEQPVCQPLQESPGIPDDFEVQQPRARSSKRRRTSGGQNVDDPTWSLMQL